MKIANSSTSAVSLVEESIAKIKKFEQYNIFTSTNFENALKKAKEID